MQSILVIGGAGFIGANFVHFLIAETNVQVINLDKLTYAGNLDSLAPLRGNGRYVFVAGDISDRELERRLLADYPASSICWIAPGGPTGRVSGPPAGIVPLLQASTDEVYGSLGPGGWFTETTPNALTCPM